MRQESKICQNCQSAFIIEPEDFAFYEKIHVPSPTLCPDCRAQRRMMFRNPSSLYKRKIIGREKETFSVFAPTTPFKVVDENFFWSDRWEGFDYGRDYDFTKPFFAQLKELMLELPWPHLFRTRAVNSDYCNNVADIKNCYLVFNTGASENIFYGVDVISSKDCLDVDKIQNCELCYDVYDSGKCNNVFFSTECGDCYNVFFSKNLVNCHDCFGCVNLTHKSYHIFNRPYSKEEYLQKINEFNVGSYKNVSEFKKQTEETRIRFPVKYMHGHSNVNVSGDYLEHCKNVNYSFINQNLENCSYCQLILFVSSNDSFDMTVAGGELCYEIEEAGGYNVKFGWLNMPKKVERGRLNLNDMEYTVSSFNSHHLFACVGLRNKSYCILNKQYTKEEYEELVPKIIKHMTDMPYIDKKGRSYKYGEFFPPELSPFCYNETIAQEYFPLTKEEALNKGYSWKDPEERNYQITLKSQDLPDHIKDVKDDILNQTIECAHKGTCNERCTTAFRIIPQELEFYRKMNLPLPCLCPNCRHYQRLKQRNPLKLWKRQCQCDGEKSANGVYVNTASHPQHSKTQPCPNEFQTTYSPERPEIVYCESCYNREVA